VLEDKGIKQTWLTEKLEKSYNMGKALFGEADDSEEDED
jgi:hypothetical protein